MIHDGLWDIVNDFHMGLSNELCSERYNISREDQDRYAAESYSRAMEAIESGRFDAEIVPVPIPPAQRRAQTVQPRRMPQRHALRGPGQNESSIQKGRIGNRR